AHRKRRWNGIDTQRHHRRCLIELVGRATAVLTVLEVLPQLFLLLRRGGFERIERGELLDLFVCHRCLNARKRSRSRFMPSCILVLMVPRGSLVRAAISDCESPSK